MKYQHVLSISLKDGVVAQEDFVWVLLRTVEEKTDPKKDIFQKMDVKAG